MLGSARVECTTNVFKELTAEKLVELACNLPQGKGLRGESSHIYLNSQSGFPLKEGRVGDCSATDIYGICNGTSAANTMEIYICIV